MGVWVLASLLVLVRNLYFYMEACLRGQHGRKKQTPLDLGAQGSQLTETKTSLTIKSCIYRVTYLLAGIGKVQSVETTAGAVQNNN